MPSTQKNGRLAYFVRVAGAAISHPTEVLDRVCGRLERWRQEKISKNELRIHGHCSLAGFHELLGIPWPCDGSNLVEREWQRMQEELGLAGMGHDADPLLAKVAFCGVLHCSAKVVVETGVARGITSRFVLVAQNGSPDARLYSIDLPPLVDGWATQVGCAVPNDLKTRWRYVRGSSSRVLPGLLANLGQIDVFIHDSTHTEVTVLKELRAVWPYLIYGGLAIVDDIDTNHGFENFVAEATPSRILRLAHERKQGSIGLMIK